MLVQVTDYDQSSGYSEKFVISLFVNSINFDPQITSRIIIDSGREGDGGPVVRWVSLPVSPPLSPPPWGGG